MDYLKIWPEIERWLSRYTDEERGRVFMAMMAYTFRSEEPDWPQDAREWCVWEPIRDKMDGCADKVQSLRENGRRGGRKSAQDAKTGENAETEESISEQTKATESKRKQTKAHKPIHKPIHKPMHKNKPRRRTGSARVRAKALRALFRPPLVNARRSLRKTGERLFRLLSSMPITRPTAGAWAETP